MYWDWKPKTVAGTSRPTADRHIGLCLCQSAADVINYRFVYVTCGNVLFNCFPILVAKRSERLAILNIFNVYVLLTGCNFWYKRMGKKKIKWMVANRLTPAHGCPPNLCETQSVKHMTGIAVPT